ncbi:hypothetical protein EV715DRAFT_294972 [Schizophyllum commune]
MAPRRNLTSSKKELISIAVEFGKFHLADYEHTDSPRLRSLLKRLDALLRHGCPFAEFDKGPPTRAIRDRRLFSQTDPQIDKAIDSLLCFAAICGDLGNFPFTPAASGVYELLRSYIPVALDWVELLHPMNGHLQPASGANDYQKLCRLIPALLHAVCLPGMYGSHEKMYEYIFTTPTIDYLVDLWLNLFRYTANPTWDAVMRLVKLMYDLAEHINVEDGPSGLASELVRSTVRQRIENKRRRLCRVVSRYGLYLQDGTQFRYVSMHLLALASILSLTPELQVTVCPREDIRTLVNLLDHYIATRNWPALMTGCAYLSNLLVFSLNNKAVEWAINDGIIATILNALDHCDDQKTIVSVQRVVRCITDDFNSWRVLRAFQQKTTDLIPELEQASERHLVIVECLTAYCERVGVLVYARLMFKEGREKCSYSECARSLTEPGIKTLACRGRDAWYCSERCQRAHWKEKHRRTCCFGSATRISQRDWRFICALAVAHMQRNLRSIVEEALALDPSRCHRMALHVDLREPAITHKVKIVEVKAPEDAWTTRLVIYWREWGIVTVEDMDVAFQLDVMLEESEKEAADQEDIAASCLAILDA